MIDLLQINLNINQFSLLKIIYLLILYHRNVYGGLNNTRTWINYFMIRSKWKVSKIIL